MVDNISNVHNEVLKGLSQDELDFLESVANPILWSESTLKDPQDFNKPLLLRSYQRRLLLAQPKYVNGKLKDRIKIYRLGRRVGKSVTLAIEALWLAATNSNFKILHIAPFERQCEIFFDMIVKLMHDTHLMPSRMIRKPYIIQFPNGSSIKSHTANVRSSRKGSSIRGEEGHCIIIDEFDFGMDEVIKEIIMPIYMGNLTSRIIGASTPSGRRGLFWKWCSDKEKLGVLEFHLPSHVSPSWSSEAEALARASMTSQQYEREIMAEFGEEAEGVFRHTDLDAAIKDYNCKDLIRSDKYKYVMGVDWNENYGVSVVVVEFNPEIGRYRIFLNTSIEKQKYTQLTAVEEIINLQAKLKCDFIYVDRGYGNVQIEMLKKYGEERKLHSFTERFKPIDYAGKIEIRDPISGLIQVKAAKPFLVQSTQIIVENRLIDIPESEDSDGGLIAQMRNFRVSRMGTYDQPIYDGGDNDHALNGLFLALVGFTLEMGDWQSYKIVPGVSFLPNPYLPKYEGRTFEETKKTSPLRGIIQAALPGTNYKLTRSLSLDEPNKAFRRPISRPKRSNI